MSETTQPPKNPQRRPRHGIATGIVGLSLLVVPLLLWPFSVNYRPRELDWYDMVYLLFSFAGFILITIALTLAGTSNHEETIAPVEPKKTSVKTPIQMLEDKLNSGEISVLEYIKKRDQLAP